MYLQHSIYSWQVKENKYNFLQTITDRLIMVDLCFNHMCHKKTNKLFFLFSFYFGHRLIYVKFQMLLSWRGLHCPEYKSDVLIIWMIFWKRGTESSLTIFNVKRVFWIVYPSLKLCSPHLLNMTFPLHHSALCGKKYWVNSTLSAFNSGIQLWLTHL